MTRLIDYTGQTIQNAKVIRKIETTCKTCQIKKIVWLCELDCGCVGKVEQRVLKRNTEIRCPRHPKIKVKPTKKRSEQRDLIYYQSIKGTFNGQG